MRFLLSLLLTLFTFYSFGQVKKIKTTDFLNKQYYLDVTQLTLGDFKPQQPASETYVEVAIRVVILTSEIYNTLLFEKFIYGGSEGGNKQIISKRKVDLNQLWKEFNLTGEITGLEFQKWLTWDSFELKIDNSIYVFKNISSKIIDVQKKKNGS